MHIDDVRLRHATLADIPLLEHWDEQPHVIAATEEPGTEPEIDDDYWSVELAAQSPVYRYFIAETGGRAIGAMLIIDPHLEPSHYWGAVEPDLRALDIWIGEASDLGRGYGTLMMRRALALCFAEAAVKAVLIDPLASNTRAHTFYRRIGFVSEGPRTFGDSRCLVHRLTRDGWRERFPADAEVTGRAVAAPPAAGR